jgi:hypothetical protein
LQHKHLILPLLMALTAASLTGCKEEAAPTQAPPEKPAVSQEVDSKSKVQVEVEKASQPQAAAVKVTDIGGHPAEKEIVKLLESGAVKPDADGKFRPNETLTRSEFIRWMTAHDSKGIKPRKPAVPSFVDVTAEHADYELIEGLQAAGVISGFPDKTMKLDKELSREELCLLWGWYQRSGSVVDPIIPLASAELSLKPYSDGKQVGEIFIRAVDKYLTDDGKLYTRTFGNTPTLNPQAGVTRAEAAQWIVFDQEFRATAGAGAGAK